MKQIIDSLKSSFLIRAALSKWFLKIEHSAYRSFYQNFMQFIFHEKFHLSTISLSYFITIRYYYIYKTYSLIDEETCLMCRSIPAMLFFLTVLAVLVHRLLSSFLSLSLS